jgi:superfamily II DNA or RNA helicase
VTLRSWQRECSDHAMLRYKYAQHYFCQATPAAGKTRLAAEIARRLLVLNQIDLVVCFAPSCQVVTSIQNTFEAILERSFDGRIGAAGLAATYQSLDH